ncbi:maleylpyruvate isomerase family mycothiol-dependent enzyme [Nonomuraea sp. NPDC050394]|uniref:maleylpyruvate isomerase family mycothiol-dependent enzyme n=1 Tax=Nonomuraea sp. NPDC050394 TaxID=3364363 RepID=UPI00379875B1
MSEFGWMEAGGQYFARKVDAAVEAGLDGASQLPGWRRRHVVAHVACNARALSRLVHWARTGEERAMYPSREARDAEIEETARIPAPELAALSADCDRELREDLAGLSDLQWNTKVRTAQGKIVPASDVPWMRARELWIHAVDLGAGGSFDDFPDGMVDALLSDVTTAMENRPQGPALLLVPLDRARTWRVHPGGRPDEGDLVERVALVRGSAARLAAWLTGRGPAPEPGAPSIGPWL